MKALNKIFCGAAAKGLLALFIMTALLSPGAANEARTLTVRCKDGILLVYGSQAVLQNVKRFLLENDGEPYPTVNGAANKLKSFGAYPDLIVEAFLEKEQMLPAEKKLYKMRLEEAVQKHLLPDIRGLSLQDARIRLELFGLNVYFLTSKIGGSDVYAPCDISVQSAGKLAGSYMANLGNGYAWIFVNGKNVSPDLRGYNIAVIDPVSCNVIASESFDTRDDKKGGVYSQSMAKLISGIADGAIVGVAVKDEGAKFLTHSAVEALKTIGAKKSLLGYRNYSHAILGIKGLSSGKAMEDISFQGITLSVTKGLHTEDEIEKAVLQSLGHSVFIRDTAPDSEIGITLPEKE